MKRWRVGLLGIIVSLGAIYFIASQVDVAQFKDAVVEARYIYVVPTIIFLLLGLITRAFRWQVLLHGDLPLRRTFSIMNVAYLVNGVLPLRMGEVARIYLSTRATPPVPPMKTASTIIVERLLDLLAVVLMVVLALAGGDVPEVIRASAVLSGAAALIGFLVLVSLASRRATARQLLNAVLRWAGREDSPLANQLQKWLDHFLDGLQPLTRPTALLAALAWTAISWGFSAVAGYILMFTFYEQANWAATLLYIAAAAFAIAVPAVPGNVGPYEGSIILAIGAMGYAQPAGTALAFAVLVHGVNLIVHATTGVIGFIQEGISLEQLSQGVQEMRQS
ncbi:MAG: flippase-like domain-containing protein [Chloroflexi bacterium]|nr:flippase-like domain-containing protein [Chloroflexota bacterium]MCC6896486.1 flippase-like domain-containing protein [Anaerolineae bacterium]